ncbi:hypothetical protein KP509_27G067400 [Ceratopteris richardii]|uniref:C2 domain-containing protein n=1 Tax=Ceratopteris richardii TaxID=49495 RepID=A0A8T2RJT0_CERRI|nr:hypothetical protein KP509_27G067400 [Ceratopteris richardii]
MSVQGQPLEITVIGCTNLKDKEWLSRQDPYVVLEYAGTRYRTKTDTDGGKNPTFNEKYVLPMIEGLREINVSVWNSNTVSTDDFIGSGKIHLQKVLTSGYDDSVWPLTSRSGKSGDVRVILHFNSQKEKKASLASPVPSAPPSGYANYPPAYGSCPPHGTYPPAGCPSGYPPAVPYGAPPPYGAYPPQACPPQPYPYPAPGGYPPASAPPAGYPPPPGGYPSASGPQAYPYPAPQGYPPYGPPPSGPYGHY